MYCIYNCRDTRDERPVSAAELRVLKVWGDTVILEPEMSSPAELL